MAAMHFGHESDESRRSAIERSGAKIPTKINNYTYMFCCVAPKILYSKRSSLLDGTAPWSFDDAGGFPGLGTHLEQHSCHYLLLPFNS